MTEVLQGANGLRIAVIDTDSGFLQVFGKRLERKSPAKNPRCSKPLNIS